VGIGWLGFQGNEAKDGPETGFKGGQRSSVGEGINGSAELAEVPSPTKQRIDAMFSCFGVPAPGLGG
jgi:hypothetical protein